MGKKQAESKRDVFLAELNAAPTRCEAAVVASQPVEDRHYLRQTRGVVAQGLC